MECQVALGKSDKKLFSQKPSQYPVIPVEVTIKLYDLAGAEDDRRFSPYCWRVKMALRHKNLAAEEIPWRFTEKDAIAFSGQKYVPVLVDGDTIVADSWEIARYLERRYPDRPSLFGGASGEGTALFVKSWCENAVHPAMMRTIALDIYARLHDKDKAYFRQSREARFGTTLENFVQPPEKSVPALCNALAPLRATLERQPFIAGAQPMFADYIVFGAFQFARVMSPIKLLEPEDPIYQWRARLLDTFGGYARQPLAFDA